MPNTLLRITGKYRNWTLAPLKEKHPAQADQALSRAERCRRSRTSETEAGAEGLHPPTRVGDVVVELLTSLTLRLALVQSDHVETGVYAVLDRGVEGVIGFSSESDYVHGRKY